MKIAAVKISCLLGDPDANLLKVRDFLVELRRLARSRLFFQKSLIPDTRRR